MKISIGADHGALPLREALVTYLKANGHEIIDHGTFNLDSVDYPDYARLVSDDVVNKNSEIGILCCTTGIGMAIAANKIRGIRAAICGHTDEADLTRRHNHANVLCLGGLHTTPHQGIRLVDAFIKASPEAGRHERRVGKFTAWESPCSTASDQ